MRLSPGVFRECWRRRGCESSLVSRPWQCLWLLFFLFCRSKPWGVGGKGQEPRAAFLKFRPKQLLLIPFVSSFGKAELGWTQLLAIKFCTALTSGVGGGVRVKLLAGFPSWGVGSGPMAGRCPGSHVQNQNCIQFSLLDLKLVLFEAQSCRIKWSKPQGRAMAGWVLLE